MKCVFVYAVIYFTRCKLISSLSVCVFRKICIDRAVLMLCRVSGNGLMLNNESFLGKSHFGFKEKTNDVWDLECGLDECNINKVQIMLSLFVGWQLALTVLITLV